MQLPNRQGFALALMAFSLGLLLLFLGLFVRKIYTDELDTLKRESSLLFVNAIRGIEGELFDRLIVRGGSIHREDRQMDLRLRMSGQPHRDSMQVFTYMQRREIQDDTLRRDTQLRLQITDDQMPTGNPDLHGALSVIVALNDQHLATDSTFKPAPDTGRIFVLLQNNFSEALRKAGLPVDFQLLRQPKDSSRVSTSDFIAGSYTDMANGERYEAALSHYRPYLFRQLWPQLLFALLLFTCVSLAFWLIYRTLLRQQRLAEQKDDFVRNMTHELKTPIATVSVAVEALQNFDALEDRARTADYLQIARLELARLSLLVDKVLRLSLFEKNAPVFQLEKLDLRQLTDKVLQTMQLQFEQAGARVDFSVAGTDFTLRGDVLHLTSVVYNLLDNALKYSPSKPQITMALQQRSGTLHLRVCDQGRGIPAAYHGKIFDRFFRVPTGDVHDVKGHGLGLSYVADVVKQHGGHIEVESTPGEGACFTIILPQV